MLFNHTLTNWVLILLSAFIIGLSKAGLKGIDMMNVTIMAIVFGGKASTGIVLPLLCAADIMAVKYYHRHAQWNHFRKLMPWMVAGILIGVYTGKDLDEAYFRKIMAVIIVLSVVIMVWLEIRRQKTIPANRIFVAGMGINAGFTTMLGNLAGAGGIALHRRQALQVVYWKNITTETLQTDLLLLPVLVAGFWAGLKIVARIHDDNYRKVVLVLTMIGAVFIFFKR